MKKQDQQYRSIIRSMPCFNCGENRDGYVSWHHVLCLGNHGMGYKPPSWATIPVCDNCHRLCHSYKISRDEQKALLLLTWDWVLVIKANESVKQNIGVEFRKLISMACSENEKWQIKGEIYWQSLIDNGVICI